MPCNPTMRPEEILPNQRYALIVWHLSQGETFRTYQVAEMFGVSKSSAYRMMCHISQYVPIHIYRGEWQVCALREQAGTATTMHSKGL